VGLQRAAKLLGVSPFKGTLLLTHLHWDHVLGIPFFASGDRDDAQVSVLIPEQASGEDAATVLSRVMRPPFFPIGPTELRGSWKHGSLGEGQLELEGFSVLAREIPHKAGRTFGYRVSDGHSTLTYMPDHGPTALGLGDDGFGEYHPAALELARDADMLIHDAQLFPEDLAAEAGFGHAVADYAIHLGRRAGARSVVLFHHRPDRTDVALDALAERFADASPAVTVAAEGSIRVL